MRKFLMIALMMVGISASAQDNDPGIVQLDLINSGTSFAENNYAFSVGFDIVKDDLVQVGPLVGITVENGRKGAIGFLVGGEGSIDIVGNALQLGGRVAIENPFGKDPNVIVSPQLTSELGKARFKIGYMEINNVKVPSGNRIDALVLGIGYRF